VPAIDRERQGPPDPRIVERLSLVVGLDQAAAVPVALLHGDAVAERADQLVAHRGRKPRNSIAARSLRNAATRVACLSAKIPTKPSR